MSLVTLAVRIVGVFWLAVTLLVLVGAGDSTVLAEVGDVAMDSYFPVAQIGQAAIAPKPPVTLIIQKHVWMVIERDTLNYPSEVGQLFLGITDSPHRVIWLQEGQGMGEECETLHHEIKHAILGTNSDHIETEHEFIYDSSPDEVKVYFRDNPKLLAYSQQACRDFSDKGDQ